jgi:tetrahydromethanopterin S-methyltransferase subunit G
LRDSALDVSVDVAFAEFSQLIGSQLEVDTGALFNDADNVRGQFV